MTSRFHASLTPLAGLIVLERLKLGDARGYLSRMFCAEELLDFGWYGPVAQVNETATRAKGTLRGMHYQKPPFAEMKLVTCTRGSVFDVVVDVRRGSPTFLQHIWIELSEENARSLLIPQGFAHGFQSLTDDVRLLYVHSAPHNGQAEAGLDATDPVLGIEWPLPMTLRSERDMAFHRLSPEFEGVSL
jgi:dTDP-4-dehydrorhamnose 3,5-epimerase